jgi:hypothetical protein
VSDTKPTDVQEEILARTVRIETKLTKLLAHVGLNADGTTPPQKVYDDTVKKLANAEANAP